MEECPIIPTDLGDIGCGDDFCKSEVSTRTNLNELNCSGFKLTDGIAVPMTLTEIQNYWQDNGSKCRDVYGSIIYSGRYGLNRFNPDGYNRVRQDMMYLLNTSFGEDAYLFSPTISVGLQEDLFYACKDNINMVGACDPYINIVLASKYPDYEFLSQNPEASNWLGCYIKPDNADTLYSNYDGEAITLPDGCRGNGPCWPLCHRASSIQLFNPDTGREYRCNSTVCVIDDVVIDENNSSVGRVTMNQICNQCRPNQLCQCTISSTNLPKAFQETGLNYSYNSYCGSNGVCYILEIDGRLTPTDCSTYINSGGGPAFSSSIPWIVLVVGIVIFLIFLGVFLSLRSPKYIKETPTSYRSKGNTDQKSLYSWEFK